MVLHNPGSQSSQPNIEPLGPPPANTLQYEQAQPFVQKSLNLLIVEMKKTHYQLLKRRRTAAQFELHLANGTFPSNLQQKLSVQNWPTTIATADTIIANSTEQQHWLAFKTSILQSRSDLFKLDLQSLELKFHQFSEQPYVKDRLTALCPSFSQHINVLNGMVLTFSVVFQEFINRPPPTPRQHSGTASPTSSVNSAVYWDDTMMDEINDTTESHNLPSSSSSSSSSSNFQSNTATNARHTASSQSSRTIQEQIDSLTSLVHKLVKNVSGTHSPRERRAPSPKPSTFPTTPTRLARSANTSATGHRHTSPTPTSTQHSTRLKTPTHTTKSSLKNPQPSTFQFQPYQPFNSPPTMLNQYPPTTTFGPYPQHFTQLNPYHNTNNLGHQQFLFHAPPQPPTNTPPSYPTNFPTYATGSPAFERRPTLDSPGRIPLTPTVRFAKRPQKKSQLS